MQPLRTKVVSLPDRGDILSPCAFSLNTKKKKTTSMPCHLLFSWRKIENQNAFFLEVCAVLVCTNYCRIWPNILLFSTEFATRSTRLPCGSWTTKRREWYLFLRVTLLSSFRTNAGWGNHVKLSNFPYIISNFSSQWQCPILVTLTIIFSLVAPLISIAFVALWGH